MLFHVFRGDAIKYLTANQTDVLVYSVLQHYIDVTDIQKVRMFVQYLFPIS